MNFNFYSMRLRPAGVQSHWFNALLGQPTNQKRRSLIFFFGDGCVLFRAVALMLMLIGVFALVQSATGRFLPHDLSYLRMNLRQLCGLDGGRVARFMFHDRTAFGGALIA